MSKTVTIGDLVLSGVTNLNDSGGWKTAEKRVEKGFNFESYVAPEPIEESIEAWVKKEDIGEVRDLREQSQPFSASVGSLSIPEHPSKASTSPMSVDRTTSKSA